ncbi:MAG: glycosyltransferase [Candidatus Omnitrophota bacterium]
MKVLFLYISNDSGHHKASLAIERALTKTGRVETMSVNALNYTNPILEKIIGRTYMGVIRSRPEFWGYLYDNPAIVRRVQKVRELIHKYNTGKLRDLLESFNPDAVVCTQAFPCGMVADYKKSRDPRIKVYGVLTDYAPHSYWVYSNVDAYFVPSEETGRRLVQNGIPPERVVETGIPVDEAFKVNKDRHEVLKSLGFCDDVPTVVIAGGSQGVGPLREAYLSLKRMQIDARIIAVTGKNKAAHRWFKAEEKKRGNDAKRLSALSFVDNMADILEAATVLVSKPGGISSAEACVKGVPLVIIDPIPGQESMNADYLLQRGAAIKVDNPANTGVLVEELLYNRWKLDELKKRAREISKPDSARDIAEYVLSH